jgi:hypothetical protein
MNPPLDCFAFQELRVRSHFVFLTAQAGSSTRHGAFSGGLQGNPEREGLFPQGLLQGISKNPIKMDESVFCLKIGSRCRCNSECGMRNSGLSLLRGCRGDLPVALAFPERSSSKGAAWRPDVGQVCPTYRVRNSSPSDPKFPKKMFLEALFNNRAHR